MIKKINGIDRLIVNLYENSSYSVSILDRFETTLSLNCPIVGFNISKVIEK